MRSGEVYSWYPAKKDAQVVVRGLEERVGLRIWEVEYFGNLSFSLAFIRLNVNYYIMNAYKNASYAGIVLYLIGVVLIAYGLFNYGIEMDLDQKGQKATGTVYELAVTEPYRQAMVEFKTEEGKTVRFLDKLFWNQDFGKYKVGQQVEVIYDPANPEATATINDFFQRNSAPWWPFIVGLVVLLVGWIMRRTMLRKAKILDGQRDGTLTYDPQDAVKAQKRAMLFAVIAIVLIILLLVVVFGVYGEYDGL